MRIRAKGPTVVAAAMGLTLAMAYPASHQSAQAQDARAVQVTIRATLVYDRYLHQGTAYRAGDPFTTVGRVTAVDGRPARGGVFFACQIIDAGGGAAECSYSFGLPGGEVAGSGDVRDGIDFPIMGGTGRFSGTTGTVTITHRTESGRRTAVFHVWLR